MYKYYVQFVLDKCSLSINKHPHKKAVYLCIKKKYRSLFCHINVGHQQPHTTMETTNFAILSTVIYGWQTISIHYSIFSCVTIYFLQFLRETQQTHSPQHLGTYKNTQTVVTLKLKMDENNLLCCGNKLVVMHFNFVATCTLI